MDDRPTTFLSTSDLDVPRALGHATPWSLPTRKVPRRCEDADVTTLLHGVLETQPRYSLALQPLLLMLAAIAAGGGGTDTGSLTERTSQQSIA